MLQILARKVLPPGLHYYLHTTGSFSPALASANPGRRGSASGPGAAQAVVVGDSHMSDIKVVGAGSLYASQQQILSEMNVIIETMMTSE
jgi:hypothetical protein